MTADITRLSPNFNNASVIGRTVIIHSTRSGKPNNPTEFEGTLNYISTPGTTSYHWVISREGVKARTVPDNLQAWHAAEDNPRTWSIGLAQGSEEDGFTEAQMNALVDVCRYYMTTRNVPAFHAALSTQAGFVGHEETQQGKRYGKTDPGKHFDWDWLMKQLQAPEVQEIPEMKWVTLKDKPEHVMFRTYLVWADASGLKSRFVPNLAEHLALDETKVAGDLQYVSIETLRQFGCSPDPLS